VKKYWEKEAAKTLYSFLGRNHRDKVNLDGVVKSPIYFALVLDQTFDVQHVLLQAWPSTKACIWNLFLSHLNTFYESIKIVLLFSVSF